MTDFPNVLVVGMHFRGGEAKQAAAAVPIGTVLRLVREPENQFDFNAIKVFLEDMHLGYLERGQAAWISPHMDAGIEFRCIVTDKTEQKNNIHPVVLVTDEPEAEDGDS